MTIKIESRGRAFTGHSSDTDIIVASAQAYMNALNRLLDVLGSGEPAKPETASV